MSPTLNLWGWCAARIPVAQGSGLLSSLVKNTVQRHFSYKELVLTVRLWIPRRILTLLDGYKDGRTVDTRWPAAA